MLNTYSSSSSQFGGVVINTACSMYHSFFVFNSSGITDTVTSATFKITGNYLNTGTSTGYPSDIHIILLKSSLGGEEVAANYNDWVGHTSGWNSSDVTEYSAEHVCTDSSPTEQDITLNSDAETDLKNNSVFEFGIVEKEEFYDNSYNPHGLTTLNKAHGRRFYSYGTNISTSSLLPYIEYSTGTVSTPTNNATFFGTNF